MNKVLVVFTCLIIGHLALTANLQNEDHYQANTTASAPPQPAPTISPTSPPTPAPANASSVQPPTPAANNESSAAKPKTPEN